MEDATPDEEYTLLMDKIGRGTLLKIIQEEKKGIRIISQSKFTDWGSFPKLTWNNLSLGLLGRHQ